MEKYSPKRFLAPVLILGVLAVSSIFLFFDGKQGEAALNSKFVEQVGAGFMTPACGSSGVDNDFICNADGTVTARIHWYPEKWLSQTECSDGADNDDDSAIDMADSECADPKDDSESVTGGQYTQCGDGVDNDGDGLTDYPNDPGCQAGYGVNLEASDKPQCSDTIDNPDQDGNTDDRIDYPQAPDCASANDDSENYDITGAPQNKIPECSDGADNDGNLLTDYPTDPGCASASDPREWNPTSWCKYVNFFADSQVSDGRFNFYLGHGTPCYLGPTEGFLWPPVPPNSSQSYRVFANDDPTASDGHLFNEGNIFGIVSFTTPSSCPLPPSFNYTLSNAGTSYVTKTSGNAFTQNTITKTLTSGTTESVTLSLSGVPGGTSYSISNSACSPTCSSVITFTVSPSTPAGTYPITVTGSPLGKQTSFNLAVSGNPMTVSCSASPSTALLGQTITWTAVVSGGTAPFTYSWSGTNFPIAPPPSVNPFSISYSTIGQKTATVTVTDTDSVTATCPVGIARINFDPNFEEF